MRFEQPSFETVRPPCSRYEGGEDDERVLLSYAFSMGLLGGDHRAAAAARSIARLHDYKGELYVAMRTELPHDVQTAFRRAWAQVGHEPEENVTFVLVHSSDWEATWASRRFESDWNHYKAAH